MIGFNNGMGGSSSHVLFWFWDDISDTIGDAIDTVEGIFDNMGKYCVEWANGALAAYQNLTSSASKILQTDVDNSIFSDFWTVINRVSSVFCIIASTLIVLFFLVNLTSEAWETRHELDIWGFVKDIVKLIVSVVVVNNALPLVKAIFTAGSRLAKIVTLTNTDIAENLGIEGTNAEYLASGVSGIRGLFIFLIFLIASVVVVVCGVMIAMEVYQRLFKIYILIPFASLSFSTFVIGSHQHGSEVFHGYIKSIIQTALEGIVIMILLFFSYSLISNNKAMNTMFPTYNKFDAVEAEVQNEHELAAIHFYITSYADNDNARKDYTFSEYLKKLCNNMNSEESTYQGVHLKYSMVSSELLTLLDNSDIEKISKIEGDYETNVFSFKSSIIESLAKKLQGQEYEDNRSVKIVMYPKCSVIDALMIMLQFVFPICLCAGAVKAAGTYSGLILGR